jgi:hypothetical protein
VPVERFERKASVSGHPPDRPRAQERALLNEFMDAVANDHGKHGSFSISIQC